VNPEASNNSTEILFPKGRFDSDFQMGPHAERFCIDDSDLAVDECAEVKRSLLNAQRRRSSVPMSGLRRRLSSIQLFRRTWCIRLRWTRCLSRAVGLEPSTSSTIVPPNSKARNVMGSYGPAGFRSHIIPNSAARPLHRSRYLRENVVGRSPVHTQSNG
jgi:hypothetical protein